MNDKLRRYAEDIVNAVDNKKFKEYVDVSNRIGDILTASDGEVNINDLIHRIAHEVGVQYTPIVVSMVAVAADSAMPEPHPDILLMHSAYVYMNKIAEVHEVRH